MDTQHILDLLLTSGQELANKGKALAEEKLNLCRAIRSRERTAR